MGRLNKIVVTVLLIAICIPSCFTAAATDSSVVKSKSGTHETCDDSHDCGFLFPHCYKGRCIACDWDEIWDSKNEECRKNCDWDEFWDEDSSKCRDNCDWDEFWDADSSKCRDNCDWDETWDKDDKKCRELDDDEKLAVGVIIALAICIPLIIIIGICACCCCCAGCAGHRYRQNRNNKNPPQIVVQSYPAPPPYNNQYPSAPAQYPQQKY